MNLLKRLCCRHTYQYYNTITRYDFVANPYYEYRFVCTNCGKVKSVDEIEIEHKYALIKDKYNKHLAMGGNPIKSDSFVVHGRYGYKRYESPAAAIVIDYYRKKGLDIKQIEKGG